MTPASSLIRPSATFSKVEGVKAIGNSQAEGVKAEGVKAIWNCRGNRQ
jgi:hypothetical protein